MYDSAKEMYFDIKATGNKSTRDRTLKKLFKLPGIMVSVSGVLKTRFLSSGPNELCDWLKQLLEETQSGNISDLINE